MWIDNDCQWLTFVNAVIVNHWQSLCSLQKNNDQHLKTGTLSHVSLLFCPLTVPVLPCLSNVPPKTNEAHESLTWAYYYHHYISPGIAPPVWNVQPVARVVAPQMSISQAILCSFASVSLASVFRGPSLAVETSPSMRLADGESDTCQRTLGHQTCDFRVADIFFVVIVLGTRMCACRQLRTRVWSVFHVNTLPIWQIHLEKGIML